MKDFSTMTNEEIGAHNTHSEFVAVTAEWCFDVEKPIAQLESEVVDNRMTISDQVFEIRALQIRLDERGGPIDTAREAF